MDAHPLAFAFCPIMVLYLAGMAAFALGLLILAAAIFAREDTNTRVRGRKDLEGVTVPFIGEIPCSQGRRGYSGRSRREVKAGSSNSS